MLDDDLLVPEATIMETKWFEANMGKWIKRKTKKKTLEELGLEEAKKYARLQEIWAFEKGDGLRL